MSGTTSAAGRPSRMYASHWLPDAEPFPAAERARRRHRNKLARASRKANR